MKKLVVFLIVAIMIYGCIPFGDENCNNATKRVDVFLVSVTPIQSHFQVNDTLTIVATVPAQNDFYGFDRNLFEETGDTSATFIFANSSEVIGDQELIIRKGGKNGLLFEAFYNPSCDCYEFEADLVLSHPAVYSTIITNEFDFIGEGCDQLFLESTFPWVNQPNLLEFEVVP